MNRIERDIVKKLTGSTIANIIVVVAIIIIPLMYGGLLTSAYQNPTNRLDTMKAAVVNQDSAADVTLADGSTRHFALGDELADRLTDPKSGEDVGFTWQQMSAEQAAKALKNEEIRAVLTVPAGFTEATTMVGTAQGNRASQQTLQLVTDDGVNYLAGTLAKSVAIELQGELTSKGADLYTQNILMSLGTVRAGMGQAASGSADLEAGAKKLDSGLGQLSTGAKSAADGSGQLAEGASQLADGAKSAESGSGALQAGSQQLAAGAASLTSGISSFTDGVEQASTGAETLSGGVNAYTGAVDQLRRQVVTGTGQGPSLVDGAGQVNAGVSSLAGALSQLMQGAGSPSAAADAASPQLVPATAALAEGLSALNDQVNSTDASQSLAQLSGASSQLAEGVSSYTGAVDQVAQGVCAEGPSDLCDQLTALSNQSAGLHQLAGGVDAGINGDAGVINQLGAVKTATGALSSGAQQLETGARTLAGGLQQLNGAVPSLQTGTQQLAQGIGSTGDSFAAGQSSVAGVLNDLGGSSVSLRSGAQALDSGTQALADSSPQLRAGASDLAGGASNLAAGATTLTVGLQELTAGTDLVSTNAAKLASGLVSLDSGIHEANDGSGTLVGGATQLTTALQDGVGQIPDFSADASSTIASVVSQPVKVDPVRAHAVPNNGAGFTPMFMSLSLWVGGIAIFLVLPALDRRPGPMERWWKAPLRPATTATILGVAQAIMLMVVTNWTVGLHAANLPGLILLAIAASLTFVALNQMFVAALAYRGRFASIVLLCLQITSMGATFPIETAPRFFQWIHPLLPMSYTQLAFREMIAGSGATGAVPRALVVLAIYFAIAVVLTFVAARLRKGPRPLPMDNALLGDSLALDRVEEAEIARLEKALARPAH